MWLSHYMCVYYTLTIFALFMDINTGVRTLWGVSVQGQESQDVGYAQFQF